MSTLPIENKVARSKLVTVDLEEYLDKGERVTIDFNELLFNGMILREKDVRAFVREHDWENYRDKNVLLVCSVDAIIPDWAYMLVASRLSHYANVVASGGDEALDKALIDQALERMDISAFEDAKVVIKGCGNVSSRSYAYTEMTKRLVPVVSSLMYGEPCSTVPVYKKPRS